ncbi:unnamed protein product [Arctogadus glacialis]
MFRMSCNTMVPPPPNWSWSSDQQLVSGLTSPASSHSGVEEQVSRVHPDGKAAPSHLLYDIYVKVRVYHKEKWEMLAFEKQAIE